MLYYEWMYSKQTMYNSASNNKAWVSRNEMGHASPFGICLLSEVRFWDAHGLYQADGLRCLVLFQNFLTAPGDSVCLPTSWWICCSAVLLLALLIQGHWEPRICSSNFFLERRSVFPPQYIEFWDWNMWCFASKMFIHLNPLNRKRLRIGTEEISVLDL